MKSISLCYLAGVLHGDGWCTASTLGLRSKDRDFALAFSIAIRDVFAIEKLPRLDDRGYWLLRCSNKRGLFSQIRNSQPTTLDEKAAWLRGLFDSEGNAQLWHMSHISPNSYHRRVAMYSTDTSTLMKAEGFLAEMGIACSIRRTKNSKSHKGTKTVWELRILRQCGFTEFARAVGSSIGRKRAALGQIVEAYEKSSGFCSRGGIRGTATRLARRAAGGIY